MLKGEPEGADLAAKRDELLGLCQTELHDHTQAAGEGTLTLLEQATSHSFTYPVLEYPTKVKSRNFEKTPEVEGTLLGIKGQYLIFDTGVLNVRKFGGYAVRFEG